MRLYGFFQDANASMALHQNADATANVSGTQLGKLTPLLASLTRLHLLNESRTQPTQVPSLTTALTNRPILLSLLSLSGTVSESEN
ncbi:hypothetical protein FH972_000734 [Carpinus fangiana]|uniref:Uncharacterized protein n=1 Tax=Carpinus fangiana TaxID=176857 RepID=A0A5N6QCQ0_9ROSI|nr:hypothetical protein FH972_000734 [Carpinus fangiana]